MSDIVTSVEFKELSEPLKAEVKSWLDLPPGGRIEKFRRERIRHYKLVRDLLLDKLGTQTMDVLEVGGGPMPVSDLIPFRSRRVIDPLSEFYATVLPCPDHHAMTIEELSSNSDFFKYDLVIATNSLDHVADPGWAIINMYNALRPGGFIAVAGAENNAITHPHLAHEHNLTADVLHRWLDRYCETVWELTYAKDGYRYGHVLYDDKRGQPAFAVLFRKCEGYG